VPAALSGFVGRARDLAGVGALLGRARLVTLAGPGGVGKTRLAREAAAGAAHATEAPADGARFPDGVWWVELAPLPAGADPVPAVAAAIGVRQSPGTDQQPGALADALAGALAGPHGAPRRLLLVLDNCEHVVEGAAALGELLLRRCPGLTLLTTSREALGVEGETVWPVVGLAHPAGRAAAPPDAAGEAFARTVAGYEAVELFVERARAVQPGFALTAHTAPAVATIAARLDGLPLALELAAAQVATLGVDQLAARLDDVFAVLTRGRRTALPRHKTLRALLDWSHHLLAPPERALLARLGVFRDAFPLEALEVVGAGDDGDTAGTLAAFGRLVEQSLVDVRDAGPGDAGETRYRLLETVRQYALARLADRPDEERATRARHAAWVAARAADLGNRTWSPALRRTVRALEADLPEIRAALDWATGPGGDPMTAVRIAGPLAWVWLSAVPWPEARARTSAALAAADAEGIPDAARPPADQAVLAELLYPISGLAFFAAEPTAMLPLSARAERLWDAVDAARAADPALDRALRTSAVRGRATMRGMAGLAHAMLGATDVALREMTAAIDIARDGGDRWWHAAIVQRRALIAAWGGRFEAAMPDYAESVARLRALGDSWFLSLALEGMSEVALALGDRAAAAAHARESVAVLRADPDPWFVSRGLDALATVAVSGDQPPDTARARAATAARLLGAAVALRERRGADVIGPDLARYEATVASARAVLGAEFARHWEAAASLDLDAAFRLAAEAVVVDDRGAPDDAPVPVHAPVADAGPVVPPSAPSTARAAPPGVDAEAQVAVEVRAFGPMRVVRDGEVVPPAELTPAKVRELLLYLALHPARTKEQIALALWPDASPAQVRNTFHVTLHQLRRALGHKAAVAFDGSAYALARAVLPGQAPGGVPGHGEAAAVRTDVDAVLAAADAVRSAARSAERDAARGAEALAARGAGAAALAAWRRALDRTRRGALGEGEAAGDWLAPHQARVRAAWGDGMEALARLHARAGATGEAAAVLEALVAAEPLREGAHRALMATYAATGEPARALAHYDALAALLARELSAQPARDTRALADAIRRGP
jgi:predicted ATPase/DNA-binding SARP family transcriptional activator